MINGSFFPPEYKIFNYKEGDVFAYSDDEGKFGLSRILKIDAVSFAAGQSINIQGQLFEVSEDDYLLIVSQSMSDAIYESLEAAREAFLKKSWTASIGHFARRTPGIEIGTILLGNLPVAEHELSGYKLWKKDFDSGEAGIF